MLATLNGHSRVVRILLNKGADVTIVGTDGISALHLSAEFGRLDVSKMLMEAGADIEAKTSTGISPLHRAAYEGHSKVVEALIEAGANPNDRKMDGATPLYGAARGGHVDAMKVLLRAKANRLLTAMESDLALAPLEIAAKAGHLDVVHGMIEEVGIEGCGGGNALVMATVCQQLDIMAALTDAGVVDTGKCLKYATGCGKEAAVKFLVQQWSAGGAAAYVNDSSSGRLPLLCAIAGLHGIVSPSSRIVRLLVDAGADTVSAVQLQDDDGGLMFYDTPLDLATHMLRDMKVGGQDVTQKQLHGLEGIRRLLLRVEAVHAVSWLWPATVPSIVRAVGGTGMAKKSSTPMKLMLPILRRRASRPRVLLAALFRCGVKAFLILHTRCMCLAMP